MNCELMHMIQEREFGLESHRELNRLCFLSVVSVQSVVNSWQKENHGWHG